MTVLQFGLTPKAKPVSPKRSALVAALDIGTGKVACLIARLRPQAAQDALRRRSHTVQVIGFGHTYARGIKGGVVVDLQAAEQALRQAIDMAESSAKMQLESVVVSISAGKPASELMSASVTVNGSGVAERDIARVITAGSQHSARPGRAVLHSLPIGYTLDGVSGIRDPRGMLGRSFGVDMHVMTADMSVIRNLMYAIESCHIGVASMVASPYAAALSALADDEADLGAALIDFGAGTTTIGVFSGGRFVHGDGFALGGRHVTMDIARGLNTRIADAERIKTLYGGVLTGGACQLTGLPELATQILGRPVRIGRPLGIGGLPEEARGPAFAVSTGLLVYPQLAHLEPSEPRSTRHAMTGTGGYFARVGQWLRDSF